MSKSVTLLHHLPRLLAPDPDSIFYIIEKKKRNPQTCLSSPFIRISPSAINGSITFLFKTWWVNVFVPKLMNLTAEMNFGNLTRAGIFNKCIICEGSCCPNIQRDTRHFTRFVWARQAFNVHMFIRWKMWKFLFFFSLHIPLNLMARDLRCPMTEFFSPFHHQIAIHICMNFFFSRPFSLSPIIYSLRSNSSRWTVKNLWIFRCIGHHGHWHPSISNMMAFSHYCVQRIGPEARWTMDRLFDVSLRFRRYRKIHSLEIRFFFSQKRWTAWNKEKGKKQWKLMNAWVQFHG